MFSLFTGSGVGPTVLYLALSIVAGLFLGKLKIANVSLGITLVLFVGIVLSACGIALNNDMLHIIKEFGLILFVVAVGFQVGPNFFSSFRSGGLKLNLCAVTMVALGMTTTVIIGQCANEPLSTMAGIYTGAVTNTPGMSAAQQTVSELSVGKSDVIANGYAMAYPLGVVGLIASSLIVRAVCRVKLDKEPIFDKSNAIGESKATSKAVQGKHKALILPVFITVALGIVLGSIPVPVGMSAPVKLGLAGGPLVMAIFVSWFGVKKGWLDVEFTKSQGMGMLREVGIALFLAAVGLSAGGSFIGTLQSGGYMWIFYGLIITMLPTLLVGVFARLVLRLNFYILMGMIGGGTTDPPMLAFANNIAPENCTLPSTGYATVYPLTMFLRIFTAQLLVLLSV